MKKENKEKYKTISWLFCMSVCICLVIIEAKCISNNIISFIIGGITISIMAITESLIKNLIQKRI